MKTEQCKNCTHYSAYYKQRYCGYEKLSCGVCSISKQERKKSDTCEKYYYSELKEKRQKSALYLHLTNAAKSIHDIVQILKEKEDSLFLGE